MSKDLIPAADEMKALETMATAATNSKFFNTLNGKDGIFSIMLYAREIGVPPMQALMGGLHNVQGKITMSAQLMNSMIRKAGHKIEILESTNAVCILKGTRKDTGETATISFSLEEARNAGVYKSGGSWDKYPSDMCFARALSRLARRLFPDIIGTAYVEDEIEDKEKEKDDAEVEEVKDEEITISNSDASDTGDKMVAFSEKFKPIENMDYDLIDFLKHCEVTYKKTVEDSIASAIKNSDKFEKAYLKWVNEKIAGEKKAVDVKAEQGDLLR